ncbi:sensor histidine kinase [Aureimonas leprariae]|uniref:sensor histidine kinase n=1 Tax=Plantimonas leprariae TaxID=2615207 RepID=UPI001387362A|nr:HAMP domain-containing sensor histidine kinase [Aureimonas leprariae]
MRIPIHALRNGMMARFDAIVSDRVRDGDERRRLAGLMAVLWAAGLASALGIPLAGFVFEHSGVAILAAVASGGCLALAALAASGAFDAVVGAAVAGGTLLVALAAVSTGGVASPLLWLLPVVPMEAVLSGRRNLFWTCFGIASLALCLLLATTAFGVSSGAPSPGVTLGAAVAACGCLALQVARLLRRKPRHAASDEAVGEDDDASAVVRFAPDGELVDASDEATRLFGERLRSDRLPFALSLVHVGDRVRYLSAFGEVRAGAARAGCEVRLWDAAAGGFAERRVELRAVRDGAALVAIRAACAIAPHETAEASRDLEAALEAATAASEAKSSFLAMVSHELRTPLNAIIGFSDVLDREMFGDFRDPRQKEYVGLIRQSGEHLLGVVNGLLDISKIEAGRYELVTERFHIAAVLDAALATVRCEAERKGLALSARNDCASGWLVADRRAVQQIILNLLANAVKFTDGGEVSVTVREAGDLMRITVADTGIGIEASELPRLGQPFTQGSAGLTRRYPGTGLGLSLVKGFAELHRGAMRVASEPGRGTTVDVTLSLDCDAAVEQNESTKRVVALRHARHQETQLPIPEARRTA